MKKFLLGATVLAGLAFAAPASAGVVYSNDWDGSISGNCAFSTQCAADLSFGNVFAAQSFTLASATTLNSASFTNLVFTDATDAQPSAANWLFLAADGTGGLPGTTLFSGNSSIVSKTMIGGDGGFDAIQEFFNLPSVSLAAGTYYFGFQAVSNAFDVYLTRGVAADGAVESFDGGVNWADDYRTRSSVAVSLSDTAVAGAVPEPATWAFMIFGFGAIGGALRRTRKANVKVSYA